MIIKTGFRRKPLENYFYFSEWVLCALSGAARKSVEKYKPISSYQYTGRKPVRSTLSQISVEGFLLIGFKFD